MIKRVQGICHAGEMCSICGGIIIGRPFGPKSSLRSSRTFYAADRRLTVTWISQNLFLSLSGNALLDTGGGCKSPGAATLNYGRFMNTVINFLIVGVRQCFCWCVK